MRRAALVVLLLIAHAIPSAQAPQVPQTPAGPDAVAKLLGDLQHALSSGGAEPVRALIAPSVAPAIVEQISALVRGSTNPSVFVRERTRVPAGSGFDIAADVLIARG